MRNEILRMLKGESLGGRERGVLLNLLLMRVPSHRLNGPKSQDHFGPAAKRLLTGGTSDAVRRKAA